MHFFGFTQSSFASFDDETSPLIAFQPAGGDMGMIRDDIPLQATSRQRMTRNCWNKALGSSLFDFVPLAGYFRTISSLIQRPGSGQAYIPLCSISLAYA